MSLALLRAEMFAALEEMEQLSIAVSKSIRETDAELYVWIDEGRTSAERRALAAKAIASVAFPAGEGLTHVLPGVIGASTETMNLARALNDAKARFKASVTNLREVAEDGRAEIRQVLFEAGHPDLSLRQAYRMILITPSTPLRIGFTWTTATRSVKSITRSAAEEYLYSTLREEWRLNQAINTLHRLPAEAPLYMVHEVKPHLRANITLAEDQRRIIMAHSPILIPLAENQAPPLHGQPARPKVLEEGADEVFETGRAGKRLPRSNRIIASHPLIPGTSLYTSLDAMGERH
jgi:hypothetical protein